MKTFITYFLYSIGLISAAQAQWHMQPVAIQTRWAKEVSPDNALKEYPRPQMVRTNWTNLNGLWNYAITKKEGAQPEKYDGQILVPYPIESALSGVKKPLLPDQNLWYSRNVQKPELKTGEHLLLHFGAVDWQATIYINGKEAGGHTGGYTEFIIDLTGKLKSGSNELTVKVYDPSDQGIGPHGKQVLNPKDIYYTPTSGIWQTVWMERVPAAYISSLTITPNVDSSFVAITVHSNTSETIQLTAASQTISGKTNERIKLPIINAHLWSPNDPFLYDLVVKTKTDEVKSYFGMRKIEIKKDEQGVDRIFLNNKYTYNLGVLDQGFWPDGLYTAPTDEALKFDIEALKSMGFNTIRKHIKIEPARWYYHADKIGMLVWQDMVNPNQGLPEGAKAAFEQQCKETIDQLRNYPCITTWVLFNEKWGQYDQERLTSWIKQMDPTRLVNGHTGELLYVNDQLRSPSPNAYVNADITDVHSYPDPMMPIKQAGKAQVVGEFGGIGVFIEDHQWLNNKAWGYIQVTPAQLLGKYTIMNELLQLLEKQGLSGSIYTQPTDVEGEQNGLMTYDREITKMPVEELRKVHAHLVPTAPNLPTVTLEAPDMTDPAKRYAELLQQYIDGKKDPYFLQKLSMMAAQNNDKVDGAQIATDYMNTWKAPYAKEQLDYALLNTTSTNDKGFEILLSEENNPASPLDKRAVHSKLMNVIYAAIIEPAGRLGSPDWDAIKAQASSFGSAGEEMVLRAETIYYMNNQYWGMYKKAAKAYIEKYGQNIKPAELKTFQNIMEQHTNK